MRLCGPAGCILLCISAACLALAGHFRQVHGQPQTEVPPPAPIDVDEYVIRWSDLGFQNYIFVGTWGAPHEVAYQASVWVRLFPTNVSNERAVRIVIQLNTAPKMTTQGSHAITPEALLKDGKLPALTFTARAPPGSPVEEVVVQQQYWTEHITQIWNASPIQGRAVLKLDTHYHLKMEGCEREFSIPAFRSRRANSMFQDGDVWLGRAAPVAHLARYHATRPYQFLVLEHLRYHLQLGFNGTMMVVLPEIAALLLAHAGLLEAVKQRQLVLVLWEYGIVRNASNFMQLPTHNLLMAAMAGSNAALGLFDLDEYLVLPGHRSIAHEVNHGCLTQLRDPSSMAVVVPMTLTLPAEGNPNEPDIASWLAHGGFEAAIKTMKYTAQPYQDCTYCKLMVNPENIYNMHVHWVVRPRDAGPTAVADRGCAYVHHFFHLWHNRIGIRVDAYKLAEKAPLALQDLPFSA